MEIIAIDRGLEAIRAHLNPHHDPLQMKKFLPHLTWLLPQQPLAHHQPIEVIKA
jgi:hypothetical protein